MRRILIRRILIHCTAFSFLFAVANVYGQQTPGQAPQFQPPTQSQPEAASPKASDVVATVNGYPITKPELDATVTQRLNELQKTAQAQGQQLGAAAAQQVRQESLDTLIESRLVEQYVTEKGPSVEEQEVKSAIEGVKQQLAAQQVPYDQFLASRGHTPDSFEQRIEGSLAWQKFQQQEVRPEKLQQFFEQNQDSFQADSFEQAQPQVVQTYVATLWADIVREMKPKAKIELVKANQQSLSP